MAVKRNNIRHTLAEVSQLRPNHYGGQEGLSDAEVNALNAAITAGTVAIGKGATLLRASDGATWRFNGTAFAAVDGAGNSAAAQKFRTIYPRDASTITDVPLATTAETISTAFGPSSFANANSEYSALGAPHLNFVSQGAATTNLPRIRTRFSYGAMFTAGSYVVFPSRPRFGDPSEWWLMGGCEFETDALTLTIVYVNNTVNSATVFVDGKKLTGSSVGGVLANAVTSASNAPQWITLTLPTRKKRTITYVGNLRSIFVDAGASVWPVAATYPKMMVLGDSFASRVGATDENSDTPALRQMLGITGRLLGFDLVNSAEGGTGFWNNAGGGWKGDYLQSLQYVISNGATALVQSNANEFDDIWFFGTGNDYAKFLSDGAAAYETRLALCISTARARWPNARITISSAVEGFNTVAIATALDASIAKVVAASDAKVRMLATNSANLTGAARPLYSGTGSVPAPAGDGNADIYFSSASQGAGDRHPNLSGVEYAGRWLADRYAVTWAA